MSDRSFAYVVCKVTSPNGKAYAGKDLGAGGHSLRHSGAWSNQPVEADFSKEELTAFLVNKEILFKSNDAGEVGRMEAQLVAHHGTSDPSIGHNRWPKHRLDIKEQ